jgi:hypothetical protein
MNKIVIELNRLQNTVLNEGQLARVGADYMRSITPIDTGNARSNTYDRDGEIVADYPYAKRLDEGYSPQNQIGLIEPTVQYLEKYIQSKVK